MEHKIRFPNILFRSKGVLIVVILFNVITTAQIATNEEFVLDGSMNYESLFIDSIYDSYIECGFNTMTQRATANSKSLLDTFSLNAINMKYETDWIYYYTSGYYSKWEAEEDKQSEIEVGVKHSAGEVAYWPDGEDSVLCWSTKGVTDSVDNLVYGPSYHQEKWYRRWLYRSHEQLFDLHYTPRFRMALDIKDGVSPEDTVCRIYVLVKYRRKLHGLYLPNDADSTWGLTDSIYLKVSDFPDSGKFDYIYLSDFTEEQYYTYPEIFRDDITYDKMIPLLDEYYREDRDGGQGVQFCIDWLRSDTLCTLYIDNIEVYDNDGWDDFIEDPEGSAVRIQEYADSFKTMGWTNIEHWMGGHEPASIDCYTPIKTVDEILQTNGFPPLMNTVWALWTITLNGESQLERFYNTVQPNKLLVEHAPVSAANDVIRPFDLEVLRRILQESYSVTQDSGFYFHIQTYGEKLSNDWHIWRQPTIPEYKTMLMLALAHGADGLVQAHYDSREESDDYPELVGLIGNGPEYEKSTLWYELKGTLIPRIKGELGTTLLTLNYSGDTLYLGRNLQDLCCGFTNSASSVDNLYLTLSETSGEQTTLHFHTGFFENPIAEDDNHFLLANLITTDNRIVTLEVTDNGSNYINTRFRNIEPEYGFDTTFTDTFTDDMNFPPGEGYLYQVAPVIKYGGRLLHDETISSTITLLDDMTIEDDAVLTVNNTYNADRSITIKDEGSIISTSGGTIKFFNDEKLIVEGNATLSGTQQNKLVLDFVSPTDSNGIVIKAGGSLAISYCEIKNASTGILSELNVDSVNVQNVDFIDCESSAINIAGYNLGETYSSKIKYCDIINSENGISVINLPGILIQENEITNTDCGIYLSNVTDAQIIDNDIQSNAEELQGIYSSSSGGVMRANIISGHTVGIHLANSSPKIGGNIITDNKYHGVYVGAGSVPYMRVEWAGNPPVMYALSGYNEIKENGGYAELGGPIDNDGSEIYFYNTRALMDSGCNSIVDDRPVARPLINTELLMNGINSGTIIIIQAQKNFWGDTVYAARFGDLSVNYIPYESEPCPEPQERGGEELVMMNQFGEVIDTVYSTGVAVPQLSETELNYAMAEEEFLTGELTSALQIYQGIINSAATDEEKYLAYERKYIIGKLTGQSNEFFDALSNTFSTLASSSQDSLDKKLLTQLSTLSKVGEQEYVTAIDEFDGIVQQNPDTEEAVYAEIDALTTALLIEGTDTTLQKGRLGKYLVKSSADYRNKVNEILRKHFGSNSTENEKELLPTEYMLYHNYPNPFNPTTTIKYDLPNASDVSLIIYDIIGRKVKELVKTKQQAGRYEIQFNASNLASGVYIYQLMAENFISSKKMILLK